MMVGCSGGGSSDPESRPSGVGDDTDDSFTNSFGMTFNRIPAGTFMMGSPEDEPGRIYYETQYEVTLTQPFYMQTTEVTQGQWKAVMGEDNNPSGFSECGDDCPVESVTWYMAQEFIDALNNMTDDGEYRLPTETEWEYAARAGSETAFENGDITGFDSENPDACLYDANLDEMGWYCYNSEKSTHPVGQKTANAWGLYDMHGNVWEWCQDWYPIDSVIDSEDQDTRSYSGCLVRGGSWYFGARNCRSAYPNGYFPETALKDGGFRLVRVQVQ